MWNKLPPLCPGVAPSQPGDPPSPAGAAQACPPGPGGGAGHLGSLLEHRQQHGGERGAGVQQGAGARIPGGGGPLC